MNDIRHLKTATDQQSAVINSTEPRIFCVAGPGSGKTWTMIQRITRLLAEGIAPAEICIITYTNAAAREIIERMPRANEGEPIRFGYIGTLHGFGMRHLHEYCGVENLTVLDAEEADEEVIQCAREINCTVSAKKLRDLRDHWHVNGAIGNTAANIAVANYFRKMEARDTIDYETILHRTLFELMSSPENQWKFKHLFVDEFQDSASLDVRIMQLIKTENRFYVGDPDQSIFGWRGSDAREVVLRISESQEWKVLLLEGNFRSSPEICSALHKLIGHDQNRIHKSVVSVEHYKAGIVEQVGSPNDASEAAWVANELANMEPGEWNKTAVLARSNRIATGVLEAMINAGVEATTVDNGMPAEWKAAKAAVRALSARTDEAILRWLKVLGDANVAKYWSEQAALGKANLRDVFLSGATSLAEMLVPDLLALGVPGDCIRLIEEIREELPAEATLADIALAVTGHRGTREVGAGVFVGTIHAAKGHEWERVYLVGFEDEVIPGRGDRHDEEEERRVAFVGMSRAKRHLIFSHAGSRVGSWPNAPMRLATPSRFIGEALA